MKTLLNKAINDAVNLNKRNKPTGGDITRSVKPCWPIRGLETRYRKWLMWEPFSIRVSWPSCSATPSTIHVEGSLKGPLIRAFSVVLISCQIKNHYSHTMYLFIWGFYLLLCFLCSSFLFIFSVLQISCLVLKRLRNAFETFIWSWKSELTRGPNALPYFRTVRISLLHIFIFHLLCKQTERSSRLFLSEAATFKLNIKVPL